MVVSSNENKRNDIFQCIQELAFLFVVIDADTNVIACIDFYNKACASDASAWIKLKKRKDVRLKACIMASLGIDYFVLGSDYLEDLKNIQEKNKFPKLNSGRLRESAIPAERSNFQQVKNELQELLKDRRKELKLISESCTFESAFSATPNSFLQPLDDR
jgi:hypothetical protein